MSTKNLLDSKSRENEAIKKDFTQYYRETSRGLYWEPTYVKNEDVYPEKYRPKTTKVHVKNWDDWDDPFRMFYREYIRIQAKKEMSYHSIADSNTRFEAAKNIDRRWVEGMKVYMTALANTENFSSNLMMKMARFIPCPSFSQAAVYQAIDENRHGQNDVNYMRWINKHYDVGVDDWMQWYQRHWLFQTGRVGFEDMYTSDPFEMVVAVNSVFEAGWTNLLFVANPAVAVANGDTMFGQHQLTTQTDETRHIAIGQTGLRLLLEADERNIPLVQEWFDKWSWIMHRVVGGPTSIFIDYFGKNKVMSYKEAFHHYYIKNYIGGLIEDLGPLGLKPPRFLKNMLEENETYSHALWKNMYEGKNVGMIEMEAPDSKEREWFKEKYPRFQSLYGNYWNAVDQGESADLNSTFLHCKVCQFPLLFVDENNDPVVHSAMHNHKKHYFCSEPCEWIFHLEPSKYTDVLTQDEIFTSGLVKPDEITKFWGLEKPNNGLLQRN
jgi:phenol/toluene 2-monooxygenase (NADH) P3/A3